MYYFIFGILYLFSLLPFFILYRMSDLAYFIMYHLQGYRKKIVFDNLDIAFPEKSRAEKVVIAKNFYRNLTDSFIETIKLLSLSVKELHKRAIFDLDECNILAAKGKNIQFQSGHHMNWEYANYLVAEKLVIPWVGIYMKINNKALNRLFIHLRAKKGTVLVAAQEFRDKMHVIFKNQYSIGLAADQNPAQPQNGYWLYFFSKPVPFLTGPDKGAGKNNSAVVFVQMIKRKRGYYQFKATIVTENAATLKNGELTLLYRDYLENVIREYPDNYLWTHRRWKWNYSPEYANMWVDTIPPPVEKVEG